MLGILFATLAGAAGFGLWLAQRLAKPVLTLTKGAKTIAAGHFDARVAVTTHDEIGTLADAFNQMADTLEQNLSALQREVDKRTQAQESWPGRTTNWNSTSRNEPRNWSAEIAERKQAEEHCGRARRELDAYFNSSPAGMAMVDSELRYLKVNQRLADITGLPIEEHQGKTIREIVPRLADILEPLYQEVFATGKPIFNWELSGETGSNPGEIRDWQESFSRSWERMVSPRRLGRGDRNHRAKARRSGAELRQNGRRIGQPCQERFPGQHEP